MKNISAFLFFTVIAQISNAQSVAEQILKRTTEKVLSLKSLSYDLVFSQKNPFSEGDLSKGNTTVNILFNPDGAVIYKNSQTTINSGAIAFKEIYTDGKLFSVNLADSTYTINTPKQVDDEFRNLSILIKKQVKENPSKVFQKADTVFAGKKCFNFLIKSYDTLRNGNHDYTHHQILIDRNTMMPVYHKNTGEGNASKGGLSLGRLTFYSENIFSGFKINKTIKPIQFDPVGFSAPNTAMLAKGERIPHFTLMDMSGKIVATESFSNKVLLVVFGATSCPANPLSNPMLNRLNTKFLPSEFAVINVYTTETPEQVKKYIDNNKLEFPVYLAKRKMNKEFKVLGTPNFYLVNTDGKVIEAIEGYSEDLEKVLTKAIQDQLEQAK